MPLTIDAIAHWSNDDINAQILLNLPKGWKFELATLPEGWSASFTDPEKSGVLWTEQHYAIRILLLSAFMWLWTTRNPARVHPAWQPRRAFDLVPVRPGPPADPGRSDLDPEHIRSVYSAHARKWGKESG